MYQGDELGMANAPFNLSTERDHVSAPAEVSVQDLIGVVGGGRLFRRAAAPVAPEAGPGAGPDAEAVRWLRRRLALALVFFVPLTDLSMMVSIFPWTRFAGW